MPKVSAAVRLPGKIRANGVSPVVENNLFARSCDRYLLENPIQKNVLFFDMLSAGSTYDELGSSSS